VRGWIERMALGRLVRVLDDLAVPGLSRLLLDCSMLRHIDVRVVGPLVESLDRFESRRGTVVVCGLSRRLSLRFLAAGTGRCFPCWRSAAELLSVPFAFERGREWAS